MAFKSQIRLQQITGSLTDIKSVLPTTGLTQGTAVASLSETNIPDLESILEYYAKAIQNIHGNAEFGANTPGQFEYNNANGIKALKPSVDSKIVLGGATVGSGTVISAPDLADEITDSTLLDSSTTIAFSGGNTATADAGQFLVFLDSSGDKLVYRLLAALGSGDSSASVEYMPEMSDLASLSKSSISATQKTSVFTGVQYKNVRTDKVESDNNLVVKAGNILDIDGASLDADFSGGAALTIGAALDLDAASIDGDITGAMDLQLGASSEIGMSDGVLTLDLNGTDSGDGLLVDAEGTVTLEAAHASDGAIILNAGNSSGVIQMQNAGSVKLAVSGTFVEAYDQFRVKDETPSTSASTGALIVAGGAGFGSTVHMGGDIESDDAMAVLVSSGELRLSGSSGVEFAADGGFSFTGHSAGGLLLIDNEATEPVTYRSNFSATTSIVAALNQLKSEIDAGEPTLFKAVLTSDVSAGTGVSLTKVAGDVTQFTTAVGPNKAEVYMNGQLLVSGSESERAAGSVDYAISGNNEVKFAFAAKVDDTVVVIDRS